MGIFVILLILPHNIDNHQRAFYFIIKRGVNSIINIALLVTGPHIINHLYTHSHQINIKYPVHHTKYSYETVLRN